MVKLDTLPHNKKEHQKAKVKFELRDTKVNIIGFWVDNARMGKLTHPGKRTHLHFIAKNNETSGHIDEIRIPADAKIYFPLQ
ncbi:MAG: acetolactate decarboxylase [Bacteroidota bacterium]